MGIHDQQMGFYVVIFCLALVAVTFSITPYITRKGDAFGISIPENQFDNPILKSYRKGFFTGVAIWSLIAFVIVLLAKGLFQDYVTTPLIAIFSIVFFSFLWYYKYHKLTKALKAQQRWQSQVTSKVFVNMSDPKIFKPSYWWLILMPIITLFTFYISLKLYPTLPDQIPSNFEFNGEITGYMVKSIWTVMMMPIMQIFMTILFTFVLYISKKSRVTIDPDNEELSMKQAFAFRKGWGWFTIIAGTLLIIMFAFLQMAMIGILDPTLIIWVALPVILVIIISSVVLSVKLGQGGSRFGKKPSGDKISMRDDDKYWKLGTFYYNPEDPAVFVEKRFGIGWTSNFARPVTYVYLGALLLFLIGTLLFSLKVGA